MKKFSPLVFLTPHLICLVAFYLWPNLEFKNEWWNINFGVFVSISSLIYLILFVRIWKQYHLSFQLIGILVSLALGWYSLTYFAVGRGIYQTTQKEDYLILESYNNDSTDVLMVQKSVDWKKGYDSFDTNRVKTYGPFRQIKTIGYYEFYTSNGHLFEY